MPEEGATLSRTTKLRKQVRQAGDFLRRTPSFLPSRNASEGPYASAYASPCMSERRRWIPSSKTSINVTPRQPLRTLASTPRQCHLARRSSTFYVPPPPPTPQTAAPVSVATPTPATPRIATYRRIYSPEWQQVPLQVSNDAADDVTTCPLLASSASDTSSGCESGTSYFTINFEAINFEAINFGSNRWVSATGT